MNLLACVNRILVDNAIIRGDTDPVSSFSDTAHNASLKIAISAIQSELIELASLRVLPKERKTTGAITFASQTRVYDLATDFIRFYGRAHFYRAADNRQIYEYRDGLPALQVQIYNYETQYGDPTCWYFEPENSTLKRVGFFLVPAAENAGEVWTYDYEASLMVSAATDNLPFHNDEEAYTFTSMAGRRFKYMYEDVKNVQDIAAVLDKDVGYRKACGTLYRLLRPSNPSNRYGFDYV